MRGRGRRREIEEVEKEMKERGEGVEEEMSVRIKRK